MKKKEIVFASILTVLLAFMDISGIPMVLFVNVNILDINPIYFALMLNFIFMGIIAFLFFKYLCPNFQINLQKKNFIDSFKKYSLPGIITGIITCIAFVIGLKFDFSPTVFKVIIEGIIYYIGVAIIEELYVRGLLLNLIEKFFTNNKNKTMIAIIISSTIFGIGHIFGVLDQSIIVIIIKVVWTIAMGVYFGVIYKKSNNLFIPIVLHYFINLCSLPYCFTTMTSTYPNITLYIILPTYLLLGLYSIYIMKKDN